MNITNKSSVHKVIVGVEPQDVFLTPKNQKPSRKPTVSITLGPITRKLLADLLASSQNSMLFRDLTPLDQCGCLLTDAIGRAAVNCGVPVPDGWQTHFD